MPNGQGGSKGRLAGGVTWGQTPQKQRFPWKGANSLTQKEPFLDHLCSPSACVRRALDPGPYLWFTWVAHPPYV